MKRSEQPNDNIFLLADTCSKWDDCDFAIINISDEWRTDMCRRLNALEKFDDDEDFCGLRYWNSSIQFYQNPDNEGDGIPKQMLKEDEVWCYVTFDESEPATFKTPESKLSAFMLVIYCTGIAIYTASGKYTGEKFWTEGFDLSKLIANQNAKISLTAKTQ